MSQLGGSVPGTKKHKKEKKGLGETPSDKKNKAAEIARLKKRIARGGASMQRGQLKSHLEKRIRELEGGGKKTTTPKKDATPNKTKLKTPAQAYTKANKNKGIPTHRKNSKKSWLDKAWGR